MSNKVGGGNSKYSPMRASVITKVNASTTPDDGNSANVSANYGRISNDRSFIDAGGV
jgi:hypothetical protein